MEGLTEGRMVHYVLPDGPSHGQHRPATVVKVWDVSGCEGYVNLQVFTDGSNDGEKYASGLYWATSKCYSQEPKEDTWHWIEKV